MSETVKTTRVPLWVKILLGLSLALNLAIIGAVFGVLMRFEDRGPGMASYGLPYVIALPKDARRDIGKQMRVNAQDGTVPRRREVRQVYSEMIAVLSADSWDEAAARDILSRQNTGALKIQEAAQEAWLGRVAAFSPSERQAYASRLGEIVEKMRGRKGPRSKP